MAVSPPCGREYPPGVSSKAALCVEQIVERCSASARSALAIHPDSWQGRLELAKSSYGLGDFKSALEQLDAVGNDFPDVHLVRGNVLMRLGRRFEAANEFKVFVAREPRDPRAGQIYRILKNQRVT